MKKLKIFALFILFAITILSPVYNAFADIPGNVHHYKKENKESQKDSVKILPDTSGKLDTAVIKDTVNNKEFQDNLNFFELIQPQHIALGGAVFVVVIFSFVILSKIRNKK